MRPPAPCDLPLIRSRCGREVGSATPGAAGLAPRLPVTFHPRKMENLTPIANTGAAGRLLSSLFRACDGMISS